MPRKLRRHMNRKGNFAIELAFLLPVFLLLTIGAIAFGRAMYASTTVSYAVCQGHALRLLSRRQEPLPRIGCCY